MTIGPSWRALAGLSQLISSSLDTEEVLQAICRSAAEVMGVPWARLWVMDEGRETLRLAAAVGFVVPVRDDLLLGLHGAVHDRHAEVHDATLGPLDHGGPPPAPLGACEGSSL
ncbi:MAG: hypothetical protein ACE5JJ_01130 [Nitrospinota bacterium]